VLARFQSTNLGVIVIQGVILNTHTFPHFLSNLGLGRVVLIISHKGELFDRMRKVVDVLLILQVGYDVIEMPAVGLVWSPWRYVDVADDLVYSNPSRDTATFLCLLFEFIWPPFLNALTTILLSTQVPAG
jgi:hypothetical protein